MTYALWIIAACLLWQTLRDELDRIRAKIAAQKFQEMMEQMHQDGDDKDDTDSN